MKTSQASGFFLSQALLSCCIADVLAKNKLLSKSRILYESIGGRILPQKEGFLLQRAPLGFPYNRFLKACLHCEADTELAWWGSETSQLLRMNSLSVLTSGTGVASSKLT